MHNEGLYELMTAQLYTAVLGSIIYLLFDWFYTVYNSEIFNIDILERTFLLLLVIAFYLSDYYYIKGSKPYRKWHFIFDLVFMTCMLISAKVLNVEQKDNNLNALPPINLYIIKKCFLTFLYLYLFWDIRELIAVFNDNKEQRGFYYEVILWEALSIISFSSFSDNFFSISIVLLISTLWFCFISYRKLNHTTIFVYLKLVKHSRKSDI